VSEKPHPLWAPVRRMLWADWDPIGCGVPDDEYDGYVGQTISLIAKGVSAATLAEYLNWAREEHMGSAPDRAADLAIAERLLGLRDGGVVQ